MEEKKALVLSGGGAKGGYHIGVWKALKEINYKEKKKTGKIQNTLRINNMVLKKQ